MDNHEEENKPAVAQSRAEGANSNEELAIAPWMISKFSKKEIVHLWNKPSKNPDFVRSACNTFTRVDYLRKPDNYQREHRKCAACLTMEVSRNQRRKMTDEKNTETATPLVVGLDRKVIRQILEREINTQCKSAERNAKNNAFEAAYQDDLIRRGLSHALFVLATECDV